MENKIIVVDQTIREGMQHKGIVFSYAQRQKILEFQEKLDIDICQAGYAPAHETEAQYIGRLNQFANNNNFNIAVAGMGRALLKDTQTLVKTGINNFHLHFQVRDKSQKEAIFSTIRDSIDYIKKNVVDSTISVAMLDIGKTPDALLKEIVEYLSFDLCIDIISLPDTSGIMAPNLIFDKVKKAVKIIDNSPAKISAHCHNDMGMANANAVMGVCAGAKALEVSVMGIGERNGISDLFVTSQMLKNQDYSLKVKTEDIDTFKEYYNYINSIYETQTGQSLLNYNTPVFGDAVKTHVAGTHILSSKASPFGMYDKEEYYINLLCGVHLIEKYLQHKNIPFSKNNLNKITQQIKSKSATLERRLHKKEIIKIANLFQD